MTDRRTPDETLVKALRILARDIQSGDGLANACIAEAATRLEELVEERKTWCTVDGRPGNFEIQPLPETKETGDE
jgi:hypothetical protein